MAGVALIVLAAGAWLWPQETAGEWAVKSRLFAGLVAAAGGAWIVSAGAAGRRATAAAAPWLAVAAWAAVSVLWSGDPSRSLVQALAVGGALAFLSCGSSPRRPDRAAAAVLALALAEVVVSLIQRFLLAPGAEARPGGTFVNANHHAALVCAGAAAAAAWGMAGRGRLRQAALVAALVLAGDALAGGSRAAIVALGAAAFVLALRRPRRNGWGRWALVALALGVGILAPTGVVHRLVEQAKGGEPGSFARAEIWTAALRALRERPLGGWGAGTFGEAWLAHRPFGLSQFSADYAHGEPVQAAVEFGLVGLGLLAWGLAAWWKVASRAPGAGERRDAGSTAALASLAALAGFSAVDFPLHVPVLALLGVALLAATGAPAPARQAAPLVRPRLVAAMVGICGAFPALWLALGAASDLAYRDGAILVAMGEADSARGRFAASLALDPAHAEALVAAAEMDGAGPLAEGRIARARRLRPRWLPPLSTAFSLALRRGDIAQARGIAEEARGHDPWGLPVVLMDVAIETGGGSWGVASRRIEEAARRWPGNFDLELARADLEIARGARARARELLQALARRFPESRAVRQRLGRL